MTLVLSMNPFLEPVGDPPLQQYQHKWDSECCIKGCTSTPTPPGDSNKQLEAEPSCRRVPDHVTMSRIAYFKRKYVEDEDAQLSFRSYCQTVAPALEERAQVLRLSLEKMRFIDDPEAFLRRSVLVNNLLRRLRAEILLQSDWCLPPGLGIPTSIPPCLLPPVSAAVPHQSLHGALPRPCLTTQGPPFHKRFRLVHGGELQPDLQTCCCLYAAAAGRYLHLPLSVYESTAASACSPSPHSSSSPVFQLENGGNRLGPGFDVAKKQSDNDLGDKAIEEEDQEEEEGDGRKYSLQKESTQRPRQRSRNLRYRSRKRAAAECGRTDKKEEEEDLETASSEKGFHSRWDSDSLAKEQLEGGAWQHRRQRQ